MIGFLPDFYYFDFVSIFFTFGSPVIVVVVVKDAAEIGIDERPTAVAIIASTPDIIKKEMVFFKISTTP